MTQTNLPSRRRSAGLLLLALALGSPVMELPAPPAAPPAANRDGPSEVVASVREDPPLKLDQVVVTPSRSGIAEERVATNATPDLFARATERWHPATSWVYGQVGALRSPSSPRLDLRATRTYRLKHGTLRAYVDIFNAYDRQNEVGYNDHYAYVQNGQLIVVKYPGTMLPLLPSAGLSRKFLCIN